MSNLPNRILSTHKVTYLDNGFVQTKTLISAENWDNILKPLKNIITIIEDDNKGKENEQSRLIKQALKLMFGDYSICFKQGSPLHESIKTGIIVLSKAQGNCKVVWNHIV